MYCDTFSLKAYEAQGLWHARFACIGHTPELAGSRVFPLTLNWCR